MREVPSWDQWFMDLARVTANRSKHPHTQVGCLLVEPNTHVQVSGGYNGMVAGVPETAEMWFCNDPYTRTVHAEKNAVALAARHGHKTDGCTAYGTHYPCWECALLLVQAGIRRVVVGGRSAPGHSEELSKVANLFQTVGMEVLSCCL